MKNNNEVSILMSFKTYGSIRESLFGVCGGSVEFPSLMKHVKKLKEGIKTFRTNGAGTER